MSARLKLRLYDRPCLDTYHSHVIAHNHKEPPCSQSMCSLKVGLTLNSLPMVCSVYRLPSCSILLVRASRQAESRLLRWPLSPCPINIDSHNLHCRRLSLGALLVSVIRLANDGGDPDFEALELWP